MPGLMYNVGEHGPVASICTHPGPWGIYTWLTSIGVPSCSAPVLYGALGVLKTI
jgi:hypothetical protein